MTKNSPSCLEISELWSLGLAWAIFRLWTRDQTMKAFIGLLMCSFLSLLGELLLGLVEELEAPELCGDI